MIISVCGFGSSGSSAVSDYLGEFDSLSIVDPIEFTIVWATDGLIDLQYHVMHPHSRTLDSIVAIQRYEHLMDKQKRLFVKSGKIDPVLYERSVNDFVDRITMAKWMWKDFSKNGFVAEYFDKYFLMGRVIPKVEKIKNRTLSCYPYIPARLSVKFEDFLDAAKNHVRELMEGIGADFSKPIVLDQAFSGDDPAAAFPFFDDPYAIVVDRDPRDIYVFSNTALLGRNHFMPVDVRNFVSYYRALRKNQPYAEKNDRVLVVHFEDMVYNYDSETERIREFIKLGENPNPKSIFEPELSKANTRVWKRYPQYADDIKYIEDELPEYLYDFSMIPIDDNTGRMFYGKSPLHK